MKKIFQLTTNDAIQWVGVVFIVLGHVFNAMGTMDPWNVVVFTIGTIMFLTWGLRVRNKPQIAVNVVSVVICLLGLYRAFS